MILNNNKSDITLVGNIINNNVSIDPKNIDIITTLLSSNLYSKPLESFIRETISNAWDSHVEANTTNLPIILSCEKDCCSDDVYVISIRDYGTGISPERFKEIYCNIGSSTKRDSNDYLGGFGLGRFAALSCSNTVRITSYYNNRAYYYLMVKDGNKINISTLNIIDTDEDNGLEVSINIGERLRYQLDSALTFVSFVPNLYVKNSNVLYYDNNIKTKRFKYFSTINKYIQNYILIGNILYHIDKSKIDYDCSLFLNSGIVFNFDIGEIDLTPNREDIIYTNNTIELINKRIELAIEELRNLYLEKLKPNYTDIAEYINVIYKSKKYNPINNEITNNCGFTIKDLNDSITYKNILLSDDNVSLINNILNSGVPRLIGITKNNNFKVSGLDYSFDNRILNDKIILLNNDIKVSKYTKKFLCEYYDDYVIAYKPTKEEFIDNIKYTVSKLKDIPKEKIITDIYNYYISNSICLDLNTDKDYLEFIKENKPNKSKSIILYVYNNLYSYDIVKFKELSEAVNFISNEPTLLENTEITYLIRLSLAVHYRYIKTSKESYNKIIKYININKLNNNNVLDNIEFYKLKRVRELFTTIIFINEEVYQDLNFKCILNSKDLNEYNYIIELINNFNDYRIPSDIHTSDIKTDPKLIKINNKFKSLRSKFLEIVNEYKLFTGYNSSNIIKLLQIYILDKLGVYKIKPELKKEINNNNLIKFLKDGKFN